MEDDWESLADNDVFIKPKLPAVNNRWAGEDEDDVKDSWEDEDEKKDEEKTSSVKTSPKIDAKALKAEMAEKKRLAEEEEEKRLAKMTPAERLAEKQRLQKLQEEADLHHALDTLGICDRGLDHFRPESAEEFKEFGSAISWKVSHYKESPHFPKFMEDLVRNMCAHMTLQDLKKVKIAVEGVYFEKQKQEKPAAKKTSTKAKTKATIKAPDDVIDELKKFGGGYSYNNNDDYDGYDDFM